MAAFGQVFWTGAVEEAPMALLGTAMIESAKGAVTLALGLVGVMALFLGLMKVAEKGGLLATPLQQGFALAIFAVVASLSVIVPIIGYTLFTAQAIILLVKFKEWLIRNNARVMAILMFVLGALIIGSGLRILLT